MAEHSLLTADAGYHSEANLKYLAALKVDALIADNQMRRRDERFATQERHKDAPPVLHNKSRTAATVTVYQPHDFIYDATARTCVCPAGKSLYRKDSAIVVNGYLSAQFQGTLRDCVPCAQRTQRTQCLRTPATTKVRHVAFFRGRVEPKPESYTARMKQRIDSPDGRLRYGQRFATAEPVFGNLRHNKRLNRFTLRGRTKVDGQWKLFCLVQNIEKLAHHGYAQ